MSEYKIKGGISKGINNFTQSSNKALSATASYFKVHWLDYLLLFLICFVLGAFDIFILKRSDNFLKPDYWYHAACRISAYILAAILGVRIGYPKAKTACEDLTRAFKKNRRLIVLKELNSEAFGNFICNINIEVEKNAWRSKINTQLKKLEKKVPNFFPLYYKDRDLTHFDRFKKNKLKYKHYIYKANNYCDKRKTLEGLLDEDYIQNNINSLNVNYPRVNESDFDCVGIDKFSYKTYHTRANPIGSAAKKISSTIMFTLLLVLVFGSVALSLDESLLEARIVTIFSIIINSILDIGLTIWKFLGGYLDCERIVKTEDLRSTIDQNEILVRFKGTLTAEKVAEYESEVIKQEEEQKQLDAQVGEA